MPSTRRSRPTWPASDSTPRTSRSTRGAAEGRAARRGGRLHRGDVLRPLRALERAAGPVGLRLVLARARRCRRRRPAVRRGQRARPALPPGDRRPGRSPPSAAMFPGRFWVALGSGEASNEHITGDGVAAQGRARRPAARVRRRHPGAARRRGGQPRRAGHRRPGPALDAARAAAAADRPGGQRGDGRLGRPAGPTAWSPSTSRTTRCAR